MQSGNPHFYSAKKGDWYESDFVSMPSVGQSSFLRTLDHVRKQEVRVCVNALSRAILISTASQISPTMKHRRVCQCPQSGNPHFYQDHGKKDKKLRNCVNALSRAILISTGGRFLVGIKNTILCQCPQSGNPHFYVLGDDVVMGVDKPCVNALSRAILISTQGRAEGRHG